MKFHDHTTLYQCARRIMPETTRRMTAEKYCQKLLGRFDPANRVHRWGIKQAASELNWYDLGRPFYNVWPCVADGLAKTTLDIPCESIVDPICRLPSSMLLRFAVGGEPEGKLRTVLCWRSAFASKADGMLNRSLSVMCDCGERQVDKRSGMPYPLLWNATFGVERGTVDESLALIDLKSVLSKDEEHLVRVAVRVMIGVALVGSDPSMVERIVLAKDARKFEETGDPKYVERAERGGVVGWSIGAGIEVSPHYRRPHFAIRWMGKGRTTPVLRPIKGSIVRRSRLAQVPSDYEGSDEDVEHEDSELRDRA